MSTQRVLWVETVESQVQQKREKIRQLYDEIDNLDASLYKIGKKSERSGIKKRLAILRQEVAKLLEPEKKEGPPQVFLKRNGGQLGTANAEKPALGSLSKVGEKQRERVERKPTKRKTKTKRSSANGNIRKETGQQVEKESKQQIEARQMKNAAYLAKFRSAGSTKGYYAQSDKEKRYWFNEE